MLRSSAGCRWLATGARGKKGAGGSALPPGTAPELAAQGVYVNTPRRHAGLWRLQAACVQFGNDTHAALCRKAGRLVSRSPVELRVRQWQAARQKAAYSPAAPLQRPAQSRCTPAAPGPIPMHPHSARPDPAASPQRPPPKISRGEKISHGGGPAVLSGPVRTFLTGGRVCKDPRATHDASHACAQSWRRFGFQRRFFSVRFCHNSRAVLRLWQE